MDAAARASADAFPAAPSTSAAAPAAPPPIAPSPPPPPAASVAPPSSTAVALQKEPPPAGGDQRLRFSVTLKPGETTIVSWKRLLKENGKGLGDPPVAGPADRPPAAQPGEVAAPSTEEPKDAVPPPNRFSAVIEKIERLYVGNESSDEELDDIPDDDQYDTEDSFIDDTELDEYFQVDKMSTKHNGYFVNKGKLEQIESSLSPKEVPKKRRRKDTPKLHSEGSHAIVSDNPPNAGNVRAKDAARSGSVVGRKLNPAKVYASYGGHYNEEGRSLKYRSKATTTVSKRKSADFTMSEEQSTMRLPYKDILSTPSELKDFDKHKAGTGATHRSRTSDSLDQAFRDKVQVDFQPKKLLNGETREASTKVRRVDRYSTSDAFSMNSPGSSYPVHSLQQSSSRAKEGSSVRPKGTTLERAIRDLEMIVAECRPPTLVVQDADPAFQSIKRRLPQPVKQKLAKVARLSASQGKISEDELVDRLMGILGHLMQRKTLKKNMRTMVEVGNSAKQQKADRFQQIKREVNEMVRARVSQLRPQGMDEDKGPQSRKLYLELAELWPNGYMDNVGIKDAIYRSKERKRALYRHHKVRDEERIKRKKLASAMRADESNPTSASQLRSGQERAPPATADTAAKYLPPIKLVPNQVAGSTSALVDSAQPYTDSIPPVVKNPDKARGVDVRTNPEDAKKKLKRKVESESSETRGHPERLPSQHVTEKPKSLKPMDDTNASNQPKPNLESPGVPNLDQAS
ncbi:ubinuclein-1-like isoform X2 [Curcuma longa]|uniref:ubinuclein-1-like isoform X2 n=1 Tax=Curcuma longa TaxID=136217 RepID=UPI003D9F87FD